MNLKIANLVAIQFGIFIGIMAWLGYSRLPSTELREAPEMKGKMVNSVPPAAPVSEPKNPRPDSVDSAADRERAEPVVEKPLPIAQTSDREISRVAYTATAAPANRSIVAVSPSYTEVDDDPEVVSSDYLQSPETLAYDQPAAFVVVSNRRSFGNRCRSTPRRDRFATTTQRRSDRGSAHLIGGGIASRPIGMAPSCRPNQGPIAVASCRPNQGFRPQGRR
jgi:hypothetical protein